jgi:N-acyl-D-amino-acid deacylase
MRKITSLLHAVCLVMNLAVSCCLGGYDVLIESGMIYDGSGGAPYVADVAIDADRITNVGKLEADSNTVIDARGLAVAPGFINMLSWANESLIHDGKSQSEIRQGVTLEILGEGTSMGPLNAAMKRDMRESQGDIKYDVEWTTLGEYLEYLERRGVSTNVASFVGAATVRIHTIGYQDRTPTPDELGRMRKLVAEAMEEGAVGVSSALIYAPGVYAETDELIALAEVAGKCGGMYISHLRSEGNNVLAALDELITIARKANVAAEFYHMKAAGKSNWDKLDAMIAKVEKPAPRA